LIQHFHYLNLGSQRNVPVYGEVFKFHSTAVIHRDRLHPVVKHKIRPCPINNKILKTFHKDAQSFGINIRCIGFVVNALFAVLGPEIITSLFKKQKGFLFFACFCQGFLNQTRDILPGIGHCTIIAHPYGIIASSAGSFKNRGRSIGIIHPWKPGIAKE